jgi:hypothetical protein
MRTYFNSDGYVARDASIETCFNPSCGAPVIGSLDVDGEYCRDCAAEWGGNASCPAVEDGSCDLFHTHDGRHFGCEDCYEADCVCEAITVYTDRLFHGSNELWDPNNVAIDDYTDRWERGES